MNDRQLTVTEQNFVIQTWRIEGFTDDDFEFSDVDIAVTGYRCTLLVHRPTGYRFLFGFALSTPNKFYGEWTPPSANGKTSEPSFDRPRQLALAQQWLKRVRKETTVENLWADILAARAVFAGGVTGDNTPFGESEIRLLNEGLTATENDLVKVLDVPADRQQQLHTKFDYLRNRLRNFGRLDYKNLFAGLILQILWEHAKDHSLRQSALQVIQQNLQYLLAVGTRLISRP